MELSRRAVLAGLLSSAATTGCAEAPLTSMRPRARVAVSGAATRLIRQAGLAGKVGCVVADAKTGEVLEAVDSDLLRPPASVTKAFTSLYAIEALGASHQFVTQLIADGPVENGILRGNLILAGGGDPTLVTDQLADLAAGLKLTGLREVTGDFLVWDNALTNLDEIDPSQLDHLGYNPTITGLNLNYNRVHFEWRREGSDFVTAMDARSEKYRPAVTVSRIRVVEQPSPVFTYRERGGVDHWTVARRALNNAGSRWLPVRNPAIYAGEVFATFARSQGIVLKAPREVQELLGGTVLATVRSDPLTSMMRGMMRFSTNLTAEAAGLAATQAQIGRSRGLRSSARAMAQWANRRAGVAPRFVDHSGLGDAARITAGDMVQFLTAEGIMPSLRSLMKRVDLVDGNRRRIAGHPGQVVAKTGTLNFVSSLAGYVRTAQGRDLAFAFFGADIGRRTAGKRAGDETPAGSRQWNRQAKALQQQILQSWITRGV